MKQPVVVGARDSRRVIFFVQRAHVQTCRRIKNHDVNAVFVHSGQLIFRSFRFLPKLAMQIAVPLVVGKQIAAVPARFQKLPHAGAQTRARGHPHQELCS